MGGTEKIADLKSIRSPKSNGSSYRTGRKIDTLQGSKFGDSIENSTIDNTMAAQEKLKRILNFKDFRGFKKIENIKDRYKIGRVLGEGSFG